MTAKKFLFRNIYCPLSIIEKTSYAYSVDNDFSSVGDRKFWQKAIESFYEKYTGIRDYHVRLIQTAQTTGQIVSDTGRIYYYEPRLRKGVWEWPISDIANYPVQGFSADLMQLARVAAYKRLQGSGALFVNSVHDSLCLDVDKREKSWYHISTTVKKAFRDIPVNYKRVYGKELLVPMDCDAKVGINWLWMHKIKIKEEDLV